MARLPQAASTLLLFLLVVLCAGLLLVLPRRVPLTAMPPLVLPVEPVRAALAAEAKAAAQAPRTGASQHIDDLWLELGRAEHDGDEPLPARRQRRAEARAAYDAVVKESGEAGALAVRAAAVERLSAALDLQLKPELARAVMGDFALMLEGEGCSRDGQLIAPLFVARVLYKARWNIAHELPPDFQLEPIELRAYYGWQALNVQRLPAEQRLRALAQYQNAGGQRADEAAGVLLHLSAQPQAARDALQAAYRSSGTLRLRNALLAQTAAAASAE